MLRRSAIIFPQDKQVIIHDGHVELKGWSYSGGGNWVERVEVSPDGYAGSDKHGHHLGQNLTPSPNKTPGTVIVQLYCFCLLDARGHLASRIATTMLDVRPRAERYPAPT